MARLGSAWLHVSIPLTGVKQTVMLRRGNATYWTRTGSRVGIAGGEDDCLISYSITSSASNCIELDTMRPSVLAAFRLMTSSNLVGCSTGKSAGLAPLRILP